MRLFAEQAPGCRTLWLRPPWMFDRDERNDVPEIGYVLPRRLQQGDAQSASTQREGRPDYWQVRGSPARTSTKVRRAVVPCSSLSLISSASHPTVLLSLNLSCKNKPVKFAGRTGSPKCHR